MSFVFSFQPREPTFCPLPAHLLAPLCMLANSLCLRGHVMNRFNMVAGNGQISGYDEVTEQQDILKFSHATAIVLLFSEFHLSLKRLRPESFIDKLTAFKSTSRTSFSSSFPTSVCTMTEQDRNPRRSSTLLLGQVRRRGPGNS